MWTSHYLRKPRLSLQLNWPWPLGNEGAALFVRPCRKINKPSIEALFALPFLALHKKPDFLDGSAWITHERASRSVDWVKRQQHFVFIENRVIFLYESRISQTNRRSAITVYSFGNLEGKAPEHASLIIVEKRLCRYTCPAKSRDSPPTLHLLVYRTHRARFGTRSLYRGNKQHSHFALAFRPEALLRQARLCH